MAENPTLRDRMNQNRFIQEYAQNNFPTIKTCTDCDELKFPNSPHEYAYIGPDYGKKKPKLLFLGEIPNADSNTRTEMETGLIPPEHSDYLSFNLHMYADLPLFQPLWYHSNENYPYSIGDILNYFDRFLQPECRPSLENIAFMNVGHCYPRANSTNDQIQQMCERCNSKFILDLELLQPEIIIGLGGAVRSYFHSLFMMGQRNIISIHTDDLNGHFITWDFLEESIYRCFVSVYHPGAYFWTPQLQGYGEEFPERLSNVINYFRGDYPHCLRLSSE